MSRVYEVHYAVPLTDKVLLTPHCLGYWTTWDEDKNWNHIGELRHFECWAAHPHTWHTTDLMTRTISCCDVYVQLLLIGRFSAFREQNLQFLEYQHIRAMPVRISVGGWYPEDCEPCRILCTAGFLRIDDKSGHILNDPSCSLSSICCTLESPFSGDPSCLLPSAVPHGAYHALWGVCCGEDPLCLIRISKLG